MLYGKIKHRITEVVNSENNPPGQLRSRGFLCICGYYPSISILSPDFSSTVKWSSQTVICFSQHFTKASSKSVGTTLSFFLNVILQVIDSCNLYISGGCVNSAFFALFTELENLVGNFIVGFLVISLLRSSFWSSISCSSMPSAVVF